MNDTDIFDAMNSGNTDRLELKMMIMNHRTFMCPITDLCLDVDRSVAFEITDPSGNTGILGPYHKTALKLGHDVETWIRGRMPQGHRLRVIKA